MEFIGREKELELLRRAWSDALRGQQQVVVVIAESRLGKTRITQEFYRFLNRTEDPHNYWPDTLRSEGDSLHVNPVLDQPNPGDHPPPWLWWGVRWFRPNQHNPASVARCAVLSDAKELWPHLETARRLLQKKEAERSGALGAGKSALTLGLNLATGGVLGAAVEITERALEWRRLRERSSADNRSVAQRQAERAGSELDQLSELLLMMAGSDHIVAAGVPLVLVLDDVQWADAESLQFIQRLMRELAVRAAARARWRHVRLHTALHASVQQHRANRLLQLEYRYQKWLQRRSRLRS